MITTASQILKKHDKYTSFKTKPVFIMRLNSRKFDQDHLHPTIIQLSAAYESLRKRKAGNPDEESSQGGSKEVIDGEFIRKTAKYWVHPGEPHRFLPPSHP